MLETWLDPASIAIVLVGTIIATLLRCGVADSRVAIGALRGLFETPFNVTQAKAALSRPDTRNCRRWIFARRAAAFRRQ